MNRAQAMPGQTMRVTRLMRTKACALKKV